MVCVVCISFLKRVPSQICAQHSAARHTPTQRLSITLWDPTHCNDRVLRNDMTLHYGMVPPIPRYDVESVRASCYLVTTRCYSVSLLIMPSWRRSLGLLMPGYDVALRHCTPVRRCDVVSVRASCYLVTTHCYNVSLLIIFLWRRRLGLLMPGYDVALRHGTPDITLWRSSVWVYWYLVTTH